MPKEDIEKFARKLEGIFRERIIDKRARAKRPGLSDKERSFHDGNATGLDQAISILRSTASRWEE